jgi:hypothetical protein
MINRGGKAQRQAAREERLSAALRENLKRRKAQARARARIGGDGAAAQPENADAPAQAPDFRRNRSRD